MIRKHGRHCICSTCEEMDCGVKSINDYATQTIVNELKHRYRNEMTILDYCEMIECEVANLEVKK